MDQFRKQQTYPLIDTPLEFSQPLQQPNVGSRPPSFECRPLFLPEQNGELNVSAAAPYYRVDGASSLGAFEPLDRSEGSSGDAAAAQRTSSFQDADLYNDLFVNSQDDGAMRATEDDPALHKAREQLDRNKRAQQRYRLRQKEKLEDYKKQLDELNQKVEQLIEEKTSLENRTQLLEKVVRMKDERLEIAQQQDVEGGKPYDSSELRRTIFEVQRLVHNGDPGFTLEDLRSLQPAQVEEMHKQTVAFLSLLLTKADATVSGSETNVLVTRIINGVRAIKNMSAKMQYSHMRKQELSWKHMRVPPTDHPAWAKAVANAGLTPEQKRLLLASHSRLLSKMDAIMRERTAIVTAVTSALPQEERPISSIDDCESSSDSFLQLSQASNALKSSLAKEHRAMLQFYEETQTEHSPLTPLQEARILVQIFPHRFEMLWLCSVLGLEGKQRGADPMEEQEMGPHSSLPLTNIMARVPLMHVPGPPSLSASSFMAAGPPSHSGEPPNAGPPNSFTAFGVPPRPPCLSGHAVILSRPPHDPRGCYAVGADRCKLMLHHCVSL